MKTNVGRRGFVFSVLAILFLFTFLARGADEESPGIDLAGAVRTAEEKPLAGARVFIYTAGPKEGVGILCPSCYADCRKWATTDAEGKFQIPTLAPSLVFRVLVAAPGFQPTFVAGVDPAKGPIEAKLKAVSKSASTRNEVRGRVTDLAGKAISGAVVNIRGVSRGNSTRFGGNPEVDPLAVTDDEGLFTLHSTNEVDAIGVDVEARGFAKAVFQRLASGGEVHELKLGEGATIKGRLVKDGKPMSGLEVGISGSERRSEIYVGNTSIKTDENGRFLFSNVTPDTSYELYGIMKSLGAEGCVPSRTVKVAGHGTELDVGDLKIEPAYVLAGVVKLKDGKALPEKTRVFLGREKAWDSQQIEVEKDGSFRFEGVPQESISVGARVKEYRMSTRNASLDPLNTMSLIGMVTGNKTDLTIELEPGGRITEHLDGSQTAMRQEPIRGVEKGGTEPDGIEVAGTVRDAETGEPLKEFTVTEGRWENMGMPGVNWFRARKTDGAEGKFTVRIPQSKRAPAMGAAAVLIEAPGYMPEKSGMINGATNLTFALKKGTGPSAVILNPDGSPAARIKVYETDMRNGVYVMGETMKVNERSYSGTLSTTTDDKGHFEFAPSTEAWSIIVVADSGFVEAKVADLKAGQEVRLRPWARIEGKLMIGSKPGPGEEIRLSVLDPPYANHPRNFPALSFFATAKTDADGNFVFEKAPPRMLSLYHSPKARDGRMGTIPQAQTTKLVLEPGKTEHITLGGRGRPVIGKFVVKGYDGKIDWRADVQNLEGKPEKPAELPDLMAMSREFSDKFKRAITEDEKKALSKELEGQREKAMEEARKFYESAAGLDYYKKQTRDALVFKQDGTFRIEDVPGGKYSIRFELHEGSAGDTSFDRFRAPLIARMEKDLEIPGGPDERNDEPYDLGVIEVPAKTVLKTGKVAPSFEVTTVDGKPLRLADYKGKYVLLDFWAVWCGPCVAETPFLKETYETFKDDPRFAMIGLSLDPEKEAPIAYQKKNNLGWTQGFLGEWSKSDVPNQFGVEGIPAIFLIGRMERF